MSRHAAPGHSPAPRIAIIDDDDDLRQSLSWLLESVGLETVGYASGDEFLHAGVEGHAILLLDVRMPGLSGLQVQQQLNALERCPPLIMMTGHGDVPMAVCALKAGAFDFIEKPFNQQQLIDVIQQALAIQAQALQRHQRLDRLRQRYQALRPKEQEVLVEVARGHTSRDIATRLDLSTKTVEVYRYRIMKALDTASLPELVRLAVALELVDALPDASEPSS